MVILTNHKEIVGDDCWADAMSRLAAVIPRLAPATSPTLGEQTNSTGSTRQELTLDESTNPPTLLPVSPLKKATPRQGDDLTMAIRSFAENDGKSLLHALDDRYSPAQSEVVEYFGRTIGIKEPAKTIAKSYAHWREADYESAVQVISGTLERVVRHTCSRLSINIYKKEYSWESPDHVFTLNPLLQELRPFLGETRYRYVSSALVKEGSVNLRNLLSHNKIMRVKEEHYVHALSYCDGVRMAEQ